MDFGHLLWVLTGCSLWYFQELQVVKDLILSFQNTEQLKSPGQCGAIADSFKTGRISKITTVPIIISGDIFV